MIVIWPIPHWGRAQVMLPNPALGRISACLRGRLPRGCVSRCQVRHYQLNLVVRHLFTEREKNRLEAVGADLAGGGDDALVDFFGYPRRNRNRALFPDELAR